MARILMVDDNRTVCEVVRAIFKDSAHSVEYVGDTTQAREYLTRNNDLSLLILDWELPGESGVDFLKYVKSLEEFWLLPVIMLTGRTAARDVETGIAAGALYYVTKPFDQRILKTLVETAIQDFNPVQDVDKSLSQAPMHLLRQGIFEFRTITDATNLAAALAMRCPEPDSARLGLHELFVNAVEHGNLGITHAEKSRLLNDGSLPGEILRRLTDPAYSSRVATVEVSTDDKGLTFVIRDQGAGFDHTQFLSLSPERAFSPHGRGIAIARDLCFDSLEYKPPGNEVSAKILNGFLERLQ
ncbi:MAG: response regulator [Leptospirales bacterium]|nr:response regulator [Leptospirales bacterium]